MTSFSILTNMQAASAALFLNRAANEADATRQRVNTGLAIGSAKDDVTTFTIGRGIRSQIAEFRAVRESLQTARASLAAASASADQVRSLIEQAQARMLELESDQSDFMATLITDDIATLMARVDQVIEQATFDGVNLLKGESRVLYTGQLGQAITVDGVNLSLDSLGLSTTVSASSSQDSSSSQSVAAAQAPSSAPRPHASVGSLLCTDIGCQQHAHAHGAPTGQTPGIGEGVPKFDAPITGAGTSVTNVTVGSSDPDHVEMLVYGTKWGGAIGTGVNLTYSFYDAGVSQYDYQYTAERPYQNSPYELTAAQETAIRAALDTWAAVSGLTFTEVVDDATSAGELRFGGSASPSTAYAFLPFANSGAAGDTWFGNSFQSQAFTEGGYNYVTAIHEIGHALGLKHPHPGPHEGSEYDQLQWSVMSYRDYEGEVIDGYFHDPYPITPMVSDIVAIQYLYGANSSHESGDTTYSWGVGDKILETIWDGGGTDTIDWSNQSTAAVIDLREGTYSQLGPAVFAHGQSLPETVGIAFGTVIENANGGSAADVITGNDADNRITGNAANDTIDGGLGDDTAVFSGNYTDYTITESGSDVIVDGADGRDTLSNIESLAFDDQTILVSSLFSSGGGDPDPDPDPTPTVEDDSSTDTTSNEVTLTKLDAAVMTVNSALAQLGTQDQGVEGQAAFIETTVGSFEFGLGTLVDANMVTESARLQALGLRQQLATASLSLANSKPGAILSLFRPVA